MSLERVVPRVRSRFEEDRSLIDLAHAAPPARVIYSAREEYREETDKADEERGHDRRDLAQAVVVVVELVARRGRLGSRHQGWLWHIDGPTKRRANAGHLLAVDKRKGEAPEETGDEEEEGEEKVGKMWEK